MAENERNEQPPAAGEVGVEHRRATAEEREAAKVREKAREIKSYRADSIDQITITAYRLNQDGTFEPVKADLPPGVQTVQEAFSYWGATSAGGVNSGTTWYDTLRLPRNVRYGELLNGAEAVGLVHWDDNYESLIVLPLDNDIATSQQAYPRMQRGQGGLDASFDPDGQPYKPPKS